MCRRRPSGRPLSPVVYVSINRKVQESVDNRKKQDLTPCEFRQEVQNTPELAPIEGRASEPERPKSKNAPTKVGAQIFTAKVYYNSN